MAFSTTRLLRRGVRRQSRLRRRRWNLRRDECERRVEVHVQGGLHVHEWVLGLQQRRVEDKTLLQEDGVADDEPNDSPNAEPERGSDKRTVGQPDAQPHDQPHHLAHHGSDLVADGVLRAHAPHPVRLAVRWALSGPSPTLLAVRTASPPTCVYFLGLLLGRVPCRLAQLLDSQGQPVGDSGSRGNGGHGTGTVAMAATLETTHSRTLGVPLSVCWCPHAGTSVRHRQEPHH